MTEYNLTLDAAVNFSPANEGEEVLQNVRTIVNTIVKSVPMDRELGINTDLLDAPINIVGGKLQTRIMDAINKFEPRAKVKSIAFNGDATQGKIIPIIKVAIG